MSRGTRILVTGAGGFIGHHLVRRLKRDGENEGDAVEIWGDGTQTRSYVYVDDCAANS